MVSDSSSLLACAMEGTFTKLGVVRTAGHWNHLYSVAAITNAAGQVVERYSYNAYGVRMVKNPANVVIVKSVVGNDRGFTSYKLDAETGLYAARARMYSVQIGRFINRDSCQQRSIKDHGKYNRFGDQVYFGPTGGDGYQDGASLYQAYFVPNNVDPSGQVLPIVLLACATYSFGNAGSNFILACFSCDACHECVSRHNQILQMGADKLGNNEEAFGKWWAANQGLDSECAKLCATCGYSGVKVFAWGIGGVLGKYLVTTQFLK